MSRLFVAVFAITTLVLSSLGIAGGQSYPVRDPGSAAYSQGGGMGSTIRVEANWLSQSGCGQVVSTGQYAPDGAHIREEAVPLTIVVDMSARDCGSPRVIRKMAVIGGNSNTILVSIFFVSTTGKILKRENVAPQQTGGPARS